MSPPAHSQPRTRRWSAAALVAFLLAAVLTLREDVIGTPALIVAAALVPVAGFAGLILLLERRDAPPRLSMLASFLWSASIGAMGAQAWNDAALRVLSPALVSSLLAPFVEEIAKGSALGVVLLVWPGTLCSSRQGIAYGALAGLGFAATENLGYYTIAVVQGGTSGLARALYLRGLLQGLNHAAFTAILGAAIGRARSESPSQLPRTVVVALGLGIAVTVHAAWNIVASPAITDILCNAPEAGGSCSPSPSLADLFVSVPLLISLFVGPVAVLLVAWTLRERASAPSAKRREDGGAA